MIYDPGESDTIIGALTNNLGVAASITSRISHGCDHLIEKLSTGELEGAAYRAGKGLFAESVVPMVRLAAEAVDGLDADLKLYVGADKAVRGYGRLDESYITQQIRLKQNQVTYNSQLLYAYQRYENPDDPLIDDACRQVRTAMERLENEIERYRIELGALREFNSSVRLLFVSGVEKLDVVVGQLAELGRIIVNDDGSYAVSSSIFSPTWMATVNALLAVSRVAELVSGYANMQSLSDEQMRELLGLLTANSADRVFSEQLALLVSVDQVGLLLVRLNADRAELVYRVGAGVVQSSVLDDFDVRYRGLLDGLAGSLSLAARGMDPDGLAVFTEQFSRVFRAGGGSAVPSVLSMLVGRGSWPDGFLTGVADAIFASGESADNSWSAPGVVVVDPGADGAPGVVGDPLAGVLESAARFSPWWTSGYFSGAGDTALELPGYSYDDGTRAEAKTVSVDARLKDLMIRYGFDQASGHWFGQAAAAGAAWDLQISGSTKFATDVTWMIEYWQRQQVVEGHKSWWDKYKHDVMMGAALVVGVVAMVVMPLDAPLVTAGLVALDAGIAIADAAMYFQEGDNWGALISLGMAVLPFAAGAAIKWIRLSRAEIALIKSGQTLTRDGLTITTDTLTNSLKQLDTITASTGRTRRVYQMMDGSEHAVSFPPELLPARRITDDFLASHGLKSRQELIDLVNIPVGKLTADQVATLKSVRDAIPAPTADTVMQKVLGPAYFDKEGNLIFGRADDYLLGKGVSFDGGYGPAADGTVTVGRTVNPDFDPKKIGGAMTVADDTAHLASPEALRAQLRLDYPGSPFPANDSSVYVMRFKSQDPGAISTSYSPGKMGGDNPRLATYGDPFTGNGFLKSGDDIIPEYMPAENVTMKEGAEIWEITDTGTQRLAAVLKNGNWIPVEG